jgi:hypothetical protein
MQAKHSKANGTNRTAIHHSARQAAYHAAKPAYREHWKPDIGVVPDAPATALRVWTRRGCCCEIHEFADASGTPAWYVLDSNHGVGRWALNERHAFELAERAGRAIAQKAAAARKAALQ